MLIYFNLNKVSKFGGGAGGQLMILNFNKICVFIHQSPIQRTSFKFLNLGCRDPVYATAPTQSYSVVLLRRKAKIHCLSIIYLTLTHSSQTGVQSLDYLHFRPPSHQADPCF